MLTFVPVIKCFHTILISNFPPLIWIIEDVTVSVLTNSGRLGRICGCLDHRKEVPSGPIRRHGSGHAVDPGPARQHETRIPNGGANESCSPVPDARYHQRYRRTCPDHQLGHREALTFCTFGSTAPPPHRGGVFACASDPPSADDKCHCPP